MKWPMVNLSTALASAEVFVDGDWVESKDQDPDGDVRLVQLADVGDGEYIDKSARFLTSAKARELRCTFLKVGDVLVARMPDPLGRACIFPGDSKPSVTVVDVCVIRPNSNQHDARWLMHCLNAPTCRKQISGFATGTTRSRISRSNLGKIRVPSVPLVEQRRIAEVLDRAEALRAKRRAALAQLDTLTQSMFLDLFGDPATNPRKWPKNSLRELVAEFRYGTSNKSQTHGKPALRIPNVVGGTINISDLKLVPVDTAEFQRLKLIDGDVLFVRTNGNPEFVGRCAVFDRAIAAISEFPDDEFVFASYLIRARLRTDAISPIFLREFMLGTEGRKELRVRSKTSAGQFNINTENLGAIPVIVPPLQIQREFARRVAAIEKLKTVHRASLAKLDVLFASLQHRAFRGEL